MWSWGQNITQGFTDTEYISVWGDKCVFTFCMDANMQVDVHAQPWGLCTVIRYLAVWTVSESCSQGLFHWRWPGSGQHPTFCLPDSDTSARWMTFRAGRLDCCPHLKDADEDGGGSRPAHLFHSHIFSCWRFPRWPVGAASSTHNKHKGTYDHLQLCFILCEMFLFLGADFVLLYLADGYKDLAE